MDAFATFMNRKLEAYFSPIPDPQAQGVDAFLQCWQNRFLYMFPPTKIIKRTLLKFRTSRLAEAILIAPLWPQQSWFPEILDLLVDRPRSLPKIKNLLTSQMLGKWWSSRLSSRLPMSRSRVRNPGIPLRVFRDQKHFPRPTQPLMGTSWYLLARKVNGASWCSWKHTDLLVRELGFES